MERKTKILIIGMSSTVGGVETFIMNLYNNIDDSKYDIDFLVQDNLNGIYKEMIEKKQGKVHIVPNFKKHPIKCFNTLEKIYHENNYDVIHLNLCNASLIMYAIVAKLINRETKIISQSHSSSDNKVLQHSIFRIFLDCYTDEYVSCSDYASEWMFGKKITGSGKVKVIKNGIETKKYIYNEEIRQKIREKYNLKNKFVIGHVGRFESVKNHIFLIDVFQEILKKNSEAVLLLVGTGSLEEKIRQKVIDLGLEYNVIFVGLCSNVNEIYQAMDVFVLPSIFEGLPIVGVEAQASGLHCVFSDSITRKSDISGNVKYMSLESGKEIWAKEILNNIEYVRENMEEKIKLAGYDLNDIIKKIEQIYNKK